MRAWIHAPGVRLAVRRGRSLIGKPRIGKPRIGKPRVGKTLFGRLDDGNWLLLATEAREQAHADLCAWHTRAWHTHDERMRACGEREYEELAERHCDLVRVLSCHG